MAKRAKTDVINLKLRIRESLRARLAASAKRNDVSLNSEIARRLESSLEREDITAAVQAGIKAALGQPGIKTALDHAGMPPVLREKAVKQRGQK